MTRFLTIRPNTQDLLVVNDVIEANEYNLPAHFDSSDVILDVGANIGAFAWACLTRGAGKVVCFEPELDNFRLLEKNLESFGDKVELNRNAVWGHSREMKLSVIDSVHTAMPHVMGEAGDAVVALSINDLLLRYPKVRLLKLDCEGAEKNILDNVVCLSGVTEICGEIHYMMNRPNEAAPTDSWLQHRLAVTGFRKNAIIHNRRAPTVIANFFGKRQ